MFSQRHRNWCAAVLIAQAFCAAPVLAQRMQFPTAVDSGGAAASAPSLNGTGWPGSYPAAGSGATLGTGIQPAPPAWDAYAPASAQPAVPYSPLNPSPYAPPATAPAYGAPTTPFSSAAPADPFAANSQPLFPGSGPTAGAGEPWASMQQTLRFLQEIRLRGTWLADFGGDDALGATDVELSGTFAWPLFYNQSPLLLTPGFAVHYWDGPETTPPNFADLPARTYDAYLDAAWMPQLTSWLSADLGVRVGVYSDFEAFETDSLRVMGRALGVVRLNDTVQLAAGVVYADRLRIKLLPAGGVIWIPNPDARYEIVFPKPKLSHRWTTWGSTDLWAFIGAEFGGGSWTADRLIVGNDTFDYNDIRVYVGVDTTGPRGLRTTLEVGYVFNRELVFRSGQPSDFDLAGTLMVRGTVAY